MKKCCPKLNKLAPPVLLGKYESSGKLIGTYKGTRYTIDNPYVLPTIIIDCKQKDQFVEVGPNVFVWSRLYNEKLCFSGWKLTGADNNDNETFHLVPSKIDKNNVILEMEGYGIEAGFSKENVDQTQQVNSYKWVKI